MMNNKDTWRPTIDLQTLATRSQLLWDIRSFFQQLGFWEVHTPVLSQDTVVDRHIDPITVAGKSLNLTPLAEQTLYLQTSPEFGMKRLLAAGADKIYQISPVFRAGERGTFHNPEFTMLEWYRRDDTLDEAVKLLADLVRAVSPNLPVRIVTYQDAFHSAVGLCPLSCSLDDLAKLAVESSLGVSADWSDDRDTWLDLIFSELVQPALGLGRADIVCLYPASQSALARISAQDASVAERFELFISGVELANGYHELVDPDELSRRNATVSAQRASDGKTPLPSSSRLIQAMQSGLPACSGCALGLDRLLMVLTGASNIDQVISFPIETC